MDILTMAAQMLLALSILVGIHEFGHLITAKMFGMKAEKFFIGFPPKIFSFKWGETEYGLGSIPLGGFVKITGMIDESLDTEQMQNEPKPWEFRAKPAWQRLIVMLGGIIMNIITGIVIFITMIYINGVTYYPIEEANKYGIYANEYGEELGFKTGDKILKINGVKLERFNDIVNPNYLLEEDSYYTVLRDGKEVDIILPPNFMEVLTEQKERFILMRSPFMVDRVIAKSNAEKAGLKAGDIITSFNNSPIQFFYEFRKIIHEHKGQTVSLSVNRDGETVQLQAEVTADGTLGFYPQNLLKEATQTFTLVEAIPVGTKKAFEIFSIQKKAFAKIFGGDLPVSKSISGPVGIAQLFGGSWDWLQFWGITGMLSMVLAFMNLLPIPALDGGHVVFITYEMITGHKPSQKVILVAQQIGMILILALMIFAFGNDIYKILMG